MSLLAERKAPRRGPKGPWNRRRRETIAEAADGLDIGLVAGFAQDFPQPLHIDIDGALVDIGVIAPHLSQQLGAIEGSAKFDIRNSSNRYSIPRN